MEENTTVIAGRNPVMEAIKNDFLISRILVSIGEKEGSILKILSEARKKNIPVKQVSVSKLDSISSSHQGVIAYISPIEFYEVSDILDVAKKRNEPPFIVILDQIEDVHNLGAIARSAEAAGCHGVIIPLHRSAPINAAAMKASAGALLHIKVARVTNLNTAIEQLKKEGLWICGTHQDADQEYFNADLKGPLAIVIGSEGTGMSRLVAENCDFNVNIPLQGNITSLNASCAAAIVIFEAAKQRKMVK
ncbi:MAG TPA: 23S rRNA (guanosine(2251)-2'-O)-methyltransferase RlmB [Clostridia bacterium]|jgi:23S rRNA (guanosine2251-2'-O)-methyltransferase|nr:MAG: putative TrmH family tRNA/rRNA methyltransferase [Firmicutes bacterium ADurb.Bin146]HOD93259.1 23S rRNA (guanosine(2251)-2'-O)-methyltransferase RlmB [Clostridia bacterium]HQM39495.1 23S rRNA (guanosine(2251)-2'-O)-methyltransferase RlmB [Clostridia bacterium]